MTTNENKTGLVLWDVDHTLIETRGVGSELYKAAFEEALEAEMTHSADVTGATELEIFHETVRANGLTARNGDLSKYSDRLAGQYEEKRDVLRQRGRRLPGARNTIVALSQVDYLVQSILTGNLRRVAKTKLEVFELAPLIDLDIGAFAEDNETRPGLVAVAQRNAARKYGREFDRSNTVILGDSPSDVSTAQKGGAMVIGIASGNTDAAELGELGADAVLDDLEDSARVVAVVRTLLRH